VSAFSQQRATQKINAVCSDPTAVQPEARVQPGRTGIVTYAKHKHLTNYHPFTQSLLHPFFPRVRPLLHNVPEGSSYAVCDQSNHPSSY